MRTEVVDVDGTTFHLNSMPFKDSRKVFWRLSKLAPMYENDEILELGLGLFEFAGLNGAVDEDDLEFFCEAFGKVSRVTKPGTTDELALNTEANRAKAFGDDLELMFKWLDACASFSFGPMLKKYAGAEAKMRAKLASKRAAATPVDQG